MSHGFYLFIDEAGDEGLDRVKPIDRNGSSEYFVMCGVLVRASKYVELAQSFNRIKQSIGIDPSDQVHFRDLEDEQKRITISSLADLKFGLVAVVSNKRNMRKYRNRRCEAKSFEIIRGRIRPTHHNWFYNGLFRYLLERASTECQRWTYPAYGELRPIKVIFSHRKTVSYSQTKAYLLKLRAERHDRSYFNNKGQIDWSVVDIFGIDSRKHKNTVGLQIADCVGSAILRALDGSSFDDIRPEYLELLKDRFIRVNQTPWDYGFKLLPDGYRGPLSIYQRRGLAAVGLRTGI